MFFLLEIKSQITIGAPIALVTVLMESSVGAKSVLAARSHRTQNRAPHKNDAGIIRIGFEVFRSCLAI